MNELWPFIFCMPKDHTQLPIVHACIRNGNSMASMNGATASGWDGTECKRHLFLIATVHQKVHIYCASDNIQKEGSLIYSLHIDYWYCTVCL